MCYIERGVFASVDDIKIIQSYQKVRKRKGLLPHGLRFNGIICSLFLFFANFIRTIDLVYVKCLDFRYAILCLQIQVLLLLLVEK